MKCAPPPSVLDRDDATVTSAGTSTPRVSTVTLGSTQTTSPADADSISATASLAPVAITSASARVIDCR